MKYKSILWVFMVLSLSSCVSLITPNVEPEITAIKSGLYDLDQSHASLSFKVNHFGLSTYVGRFNSISASLDFDPEKIEKTKLEALIDMRSIDVNNEELEKMLQTSKWLDTERFPQAKFTTTRVGNIQGNEFDLVGELSWRGATTPMTLKTKFHGGANNILTGKYTVGFSADGEFLRTAHGMRAYVPLVGDKVIIEAHGEFQRN